MGWRGANMARFTGTTFDETITPTTVSPTVTADPPGSRPSAAADTIEGRGGRDTIGGGGGNDIIASTVGGGTVHGDAGDDQITITHETAWKTIAAEPDQFVDGSDLTFQLPGARVSVTGETETSVIAANGIIQDPGPGAPSGPHNFATTGTLVFGQDPANAPGGGFGEGMPLWNADEFGLLRADFSEPTNFVSIDFAFDDDDVGSLKAFDANGALLEEVTGSGDGRGANPTFTGSIARDAADISYITAGGVAKEALYLDNLHYNVQAETDSVSGTFYGDDGNDTVTFNSWQSYGGQPSGTLTMRGGGGNDTLASEGAVLSDYSDLVIKLYGEAGNDRLEAFASSTFSMVYQWAPDARDYLYGGPGDDFYRLIGASDDVVVENANEGYDTVEVYQGSYALGANLEKLVADAIDGSFTYKGNVLNNELIGDDYAGDTLYGKPLGLAQGSNTDADTIRGGGGDDLIYGGGGDTDTWDGDDRLYGDAGNDRIFGHNGNDLMYGGTGNDEMGGQAGNDTLYGDAGIDKLGGGSGNDLLYGGTENDTLSGRDGLDKLYGQGGNDTFRYEAVTDSKPGASLRDVITDFAGIGSSQTIDKIDLSTIDANIGLSGNQAFAFKGTSAFTGAGQLRLMSSGTDTVIQANTGGSLAQEMEIAVTDGATLPGAWSASDFVL